MSSRLILTTTNSIETQKIEKYLGIVSDRVVVGAGMLSEFFAAFTDVFGGRSSKFEERLDELYNSLILSLTKKARKMRAHAIVGLKVDIDEISGKNTQMFMVSGIGTAVRFATDGTEIASDKVTGAVHDIDGISLENEIRRIKFAASLRNLAHISVKSANQEQEHAFNNILTEAAAYAIRLPLDAVLTTFFNFFINNSQFDLSPLIEYLQTEKPDELHSLLHQNLLIHVGSNLDALGVRMHTNTSFVRLYSELSAPKYDIIYTIVRETPPHLWMYTVFPLFQSHKYFYGSDELESIDAIITELQRETFPVVWRTEKRGYSKQTICVCGTVVQTTQTAVCPNCQKNSTGFSKKDFEMRDRVVWHLKCVKQAIRALQA